MIKLSKESVYNLKRMIVKNAIYMKLAVNDTVLPDTGSANPGADSTVAPTVPTIKPQKEPMSFKGINAKKMTPNQAGGADNMSGAYAFGGLGAGLGSENKG